MEVSIEEKEGWMKPIKHAPITHFYKKHNKSAENEKNRNRYYGFGEDVGIKNAEYEEEKEGWTKPIKHTPIACFYKKCNKSTECVKK